MEVSIYRFLEVFNMRVVPERYDVTIFHINVQFVLLGEIVKFILKVLSIFNVSIQAKYGPFLEVDRLMYKLVKDPGIIESFSLFLMWINDRRLVKNLSADFVRFNTQVKVPFSDLFGLTNGLV